MASCNELYSFLAAKPAERGPVIEPLFDLRLPIDVCPVACCHGVGASILDSYAVAKRCEDREGLRVQMLVVQQIVVVMDGEVNLLTFWQADAFAAFCCFRSRLNRVARFAAQNVRLALFLPR
jgi:hypothetical protein